MPIRQPSTKLGPPTQTAVDGLASGLKRLLHGATNGKSAAVILPYALQLICDLIHVQLAVLLMCDKRSGKLAVRLHHGLELPAQLVGHPIDPSKNPLFERLLESQAAFHWLADEHKNSLAAIPLKLLGDKDGLLFSMHIEGKPIGLIMACRPAGADHLTPQQFKTFKQLCSTTTNALTVIQRGAKSANGEPLSA